MCVTYRGGLYFIEFASGIENYSNVNRGLPERVRIKDCTRKWFQCTVKQRF